MAEIKLGQIKEGFMSISSFFFAVGLIFLLIAVIIHFCIVPSIIRKLPQYPKDETKENIMRYNLETELNYKEQNVLNNVMTWCVIIGGLFIGIGNGLSDY